MPLGIRITPEMRAQLESRATATGRSVTQQVELLLEFAIRDEHAIEAAFDFAFARRTAGSLLLIAEAITFSAQQAAAIAGDKGRGGDWLDQPFVFDQVVKGITRAFEAMRPQGDGAPPSYAEMYEEWQSVDLSPIAERIGERATATVLDAVIDPANAQVGLGLRARPIAERLGPELVERISASRSVRPAKPLEGANER